MQHLLAFADRSVDSDGDSDSERQQAQQQQPLARKRKAKQQPSTEPKPKKSQRLYKPSDEITAAHFKVRIADLTRRVGGDMRRHLLHHFDKDPFLLISILKDTSVIAAMKERLGEKATAALLLEDDISPQRAISLLLQSHLAHTDYLVWHKTFPKLPSLNYVKQCMTEHQPDLLPVYVMVKKSKPAPKVSLQQQQPPPDQPAPTSDQQPGEDEEELAEGDWDWNPEHDPVPAPSEDDFGWMRQAVPILSRPPPHNTSRMPILPAEWDLHPLSTAQPPLPPSTARTPLPPSTARTPLPPSTAQTPLPPSTAQISLPPSTAPDPPPTCRTPAALPPTAPETPADEEVSRRIGFVVPRSYIYKVILQGVELLLQYDPHARELVIKIGGDNFTRIPWCNTGTEHYEQVRA